jgi:hypothetical protein
MINLPLDPTPGIGWGPFTLPDSHPFFICAVAHDAAYDDIKEGICKYTLKQVDKMFFRNCVRVAAREGFINKDPAEFAKLAREAWIMYGIVRAWAKLFRKDFEKWRPGNGPLKGTNGKQ